MPCSFSISQHADPVDLRIAGLVVLVDAGVDAAPAADAAREVEAVAELDPVHGRRVGDRDARGRTRSLYSRSSSARISALRSGAQLDEIAVRSSRSTKPVDAPATAAADTAGHRGQTRR